MRTRFALITALAMLMSVAPVTVSPGLEAAGPQQNPTAQQPPQQSPPDMAAMMKMHEQMMGEMKANQAKLDALVKTMNAATGASAIEAIKAVVTELAREHQAMYGRMGEMHQQQMMMMGGRGMMRGR